MTITEKTLRIKKLSQDIYRYQKKVSKKSDFMFTPGRGHQFNHKIGNHYKELSILEDLKQELKELVKTL